MSARKWSWWVSLGGGVWTWFLASWSGVSPLTCMFRALTVFVMLFAAATLFQTLLEAQGSRRGEVVREQNPSPDTTEHEPEDAEQRQAA